MSDIIVIGVDGSATAQKAAESAKDLAMALNASLHVVTAFDGDQDEVFGSGHDQLVVSPGDAAEHLARTAAESLGNGITITSAAVPGKPAEALIEEAARINARIIVVGNRRMHGIGRVLGSVANSVAHNAHCDVYIANTYDA
ncbi:nucleotide-binding universal stress UspA family protein [Arthrobacter oryzae]|uniref:universal stress protein n=1 Tax=Arthrobacter oryzae TaxID=409290 RepID=UPI00278B5C54|nr:universal stress protein [Arthrobacter oryzae]MDP9987426.1 nucleotide-binding universal stress UspA family protein [Arthrobacter oryzae]